MNMNHLVCHYKTLIVIVTLLILTYQVLILLLFLCYLSNSIMVMFREFYDNDPSLPVYQWNNANEHYSLAKLAQIIAY